MSTAPSGTETVYEITIQGGTEKAPSKDHLDKFLHDLFNAMVKQLDPDPNAPTEWTLKVLPGPNSNSLLVRVTCKIVGPPRSYESYRQHMLGETPQ